MTLSDGAGPDGMSYELHYSTPGHHQSIAFALDPMIDSFSDSRHNDHTYWTSLIYIIIKYLVIIIVSSKYYTRRVYSLESFNIHGGGCTNIQPATDVIVLLCGSSQCIVISSETVAAHRWSQCHRHGFRFSCFAVCRD